MSDPVVLPAMNESQRQSWHALLELYERVAVGWTLIGGQLVHLHCAERGEQPTRPTNDVDTVVDIRASPDMLTTFTGALRDLGFSAETSAEGTQHRWRRDRAQVDVLVPDGVGERAASRSGASGAPTLAAPGTTQALHRTESVSIVVEGRSGVVRRPNLVGALVSKAAARTEIVSDRSAARHCADFVALGGLVAARDFRGVELSKKDRARLRRMIAVCRQDDSTRSMDRGDEVLDRLERAARLTG